MTVTIIILIYHHCPNFGCWCCSFGFATGRTHLFPLTPQSQSHHHCHKDVNFCKYLKLKAENTILCLSIVIALLPKPITNGQSSQCEQNMRHRSLSTGIVQVRWGLFLDRHRGELASLPLAKLVREGEKRKCMQWNPPLCLTLPLGGRKLRKLPPADFARRVITTSVTVGISFH